MFKRLASGATDLSEDEQRLRDVLRRHWATPGAFHRSSYEHPLPARPVRPFPRGPGRSGAWETHIAETLANLGPAAGAGGAAARGVLLQSVRLLQGRRRGPVAVHALDRSALHAHRFAVDDRLDPFRSTEAAAQLLAYNYRLLGTWPLALTAYNHGSAGMLRAKESMGTDDIVRSCAATPAAPSASPRATSTSPSLRRSRSTATRRSTSGRWSASRPCYH